MKEFSLTIYNEDGSVKWVVDVVKTPGNSQPYRVVNPENNRTLSKGYTAQNALSTFFQYQNQLFDQQKILTKDERDSLLSELRKKIPQVVSVNESSDEDGSFFRIGLTEDIPESEKIDTFKYQRLKYVISGKIVAL